MLAIKQILFPTDFSERCRAAAPFVTTLASRFGASITVLSAAQPFFYAGIGDPGGPVAADPDELLQSLRTNLDCFLKNELAGFSVNRVAELGEPAGVIVDYARVHGIDLIMMPTHGYGPFKSLVLGSVTEGVLHYARCPVWTDAHVETAPTKEHLEFRRIMCAIDGTANSVPLMKWAADLSQATGASLRLAHALPTVGGWPSVQTERQVEHEMIQEADMHIAGLQAAAGINVPVCVAIGDVAATVAEEARRHSSDLVVIARGALHETLGRLRTHSYGIVRSAPCPVLSV